MQPPTTAYTPTDSNLHIPISKYGGIIRRVGLMSRVIESGVPINLPYKTGLCLTSQVNGTFTTADGKHHNPDAIDELIAQHYVSYLRESSEIPIVNQEPPAFEPDVHILIRNFDLWREQVKTENGYSEMYLSSTHPAGRVTVKSDFISKFMDRTQIKYWVMPNLNNVEDLTQSVKILCATLRNAIPDIKVKVHSDTFSYSLIDRVLYIHQAPIHINTIKIQENYVTFDSIPVDPIEFSKFFYYPQELHNLTTLQVFTPIQLGAIKMWFESNEEWRVLPLYDTAMSLVRQEFENRSEMVKHPIYTYFKTMTTATKVLSALLGVFTLTATIYTIYRLCTRESSDKSNTTLDPRLEAKYESYQREYVDGVMSGKYKDRGDFAAAIAARTGDSNLATGWVNYNYDITANSKEFDREKLMFSLCRAIKEKDESTAKLIFDQINKQKPLDVQDITNIVRQNTNAVSVHYEHTPDKTLIGKFVEVLQKNVCKVVSNGRHCYGIFVKDNILVTVAHLFDGPKDDVSIYWSSNTHDMSNLYKAKITNINYDKDLAILRIVDTSFPMQKDITKHLPYACDTETWSGSCYYIRPLTKTMIYHGAATKHHYTLQKRWDANNPRYRPRVWYTYEYTQCLHVSDVFKDGDCGFPLVTVKDNKCYILGIHNGYDGTGSSFFSPLTCNEFQLLREVQIPKETVSNALEIANTRVVSDKPHVDLPPYNTIINEQTITPDKLWEKYHNQLDIVGRCSNMYFHTNPKHVKKNFHDSNCQLENPSLPSPLDLKMLPTETIIKLPRDSKYRPSPLMAQCLKFSKYNELNINPEIFDQAKNIQLDLYRQNYGELSILRTAQAINGTFDGPLKSLVLETSPGPYIKKMYCMDNKRALFTDVNQNDPTKPTWYVFSEHPAAKELRIHCDAIMDSWQTGVPTVVFIKDNPKVELLPKEKVLNEGKIRLFCELDLAVNIVIRRLIGDLTAKMQEFHYLTNAKLGINPYRDLHWYSKGFPKQNVDIFGYDIKRMDKNVPAALMAYFFELCKNLLKKEHQELAGAAYETCAKSLSNAVHCMEGLLYRTVRGNPSGVVGTNTINTVLLELMTIYTHIKITLQLPMEITSHTSSSYMCDIHGFLTGDNGYIVVSKDFGYTEEKIKQGFIDFGFELLFDKSGLQGTEWCGREIYYSGGFLIPALRKEAIVRQIFWINMGRRADIPNQFLIVQMEAAMHDRHFFQQVKADILYIAKKIN